MQPNVDHELYLRIAELIAAERGTCARRNVGAVLTASGRVREVGWNGMERSSLATRCDEGGCPRGQLTVEQQPHGSGYHNCVYIHAEANALWNFRASQAVRDEAGWAARMQVVVYSSSEPCEDCQKYAVFAGAELIWRDKDVNG